MARQTVGAAIIGIALLAASCGAAEDLSANEFESALEQNLSEGANVEIDPDSESISVEDDAGEFVTGTDLSRPSWLPASIPLPDGFRFDTILNTGEIESVRGRIDGADAAALSDLFTNALRDLNWQIDSQVIDEPAFFQILTTTEDGEFFDIELVNGSLAFVLGRARPTAE